MGVHRRRGGPAGLSAAIHLAWHGRRVLVVDRRSGPLFFTLEQLHNVPGMPATRGLDLQKQLKQQAKALGAEVMRANVVSASGSSGDFELVTDGGDQLATEAVLLATGVARYHPTVDGDYRPCFKYAGKGNLYYCPDCEAPEIEGKDTVVIATSSADGGASMAVGLSRYTPRIRLLLTEDQNLRDGPRKSLDKRGIDVIRGAIHNLDGERSWLQALELDNGSRVEAEAFFVSSPALGRTDLAQQLGVEMAATGHHAQPKSQRGDTNVEGVWIAGDLRPMSQQVAVAMGTGNIAALMIDQTLRRRDVSHK